MNGLTSLDAPSSAGLFELVDRDGDGKIDKDEFGKLYHVVKAQALKDDAQVRLELDLAL